MRLLHLLLSTFPLSSAFIPQIPLKVPPCHSSTQLAVGIPVGGARRAKVALAGRIWPVLQKFYVSHIEAKLIFRNILEVTQWQDLLLLGAVFFGASPLSRAWYNRLPISVREDKLFETTRRYGVAKAVSQVALVALSVYAVDVVSVTLSTIGFTFVDQWDVSASYAKIAYIGWALYRGLELKKYSLCRIFKVDPENMGRVEVLNSFLDGIIIALTSLLLFDWLSVKMNMTMRGFFAFGSVGTIALTLASQGLATQLVSGIFLFLSGKFFQGDYVRFGDGTNGTILKMGWMDTVIRNGDNTFMRVPNAKLASQTISNVSRVKQCQVKQILRFYYDDVDKIPDILDAIKTELKASCPRLVSNGKRPFRVFWTDFNEDHLEVTVDTHHDVAPIGDAYWNTRQQVLMAIARAVRQNNVQFAQLYSFATSGSEPEWRALPRGAFSLSEHTSADEGAGDDTDDDNAWSSNSAPSQE